MKIYFLIVSSLIFLLVSIFFFHQKLDKSFIISPNNQTWSTTSKDKNKFKTQFIIIILILQTTLHLLFTTDNLLVFFITFEFSAIPLFFLIGFFGKRSLKIKAMHYLLYYTLFSAVPFFIAIMYLYSICGSFDYFTINNYIFNQVVPQQVINLLFISFFIPFCVKLAIFPFHV